MIAGWTLEAEDCQAFHTKHFVSSTSLIDHDSRGSPSLQLCKPPPSPSWRCQRNTLPTCSARLAARLHNCYRLTPRWHVPYHTENAKGLLFATYPWHVFNTHELRLLSFGILAWWNCDHNSKGSMFLFTFLGIGVELTQEISLRTKVMWEEALYDLLLVL
jgi:hypothetical protein